ncbi:sulfotransferase family protein [Actinomadura kijaniata]|uniref:sulfotransferase family protein n=1 Tax=Actinomadura kijaniata TaxID=46161 RepID=UPI003F1A9D78
MKVIGAGFGRTGTSSLREALERLGFGPCYHMREVARDPSRAAAWRAAAQGVPVDWERVLDGYASTVDWPGAAFWEELAERFPEAKVVLTVRDADQWYDSARRTVFAGSIRSERPLVRLGFQAVRTLDPRFGAFTRMINEAVHDRVFGFPLSDRERVLEVYRRHLERVRETVPADRLLVYDVREGWEPLCAFLGVPVPDEPFPRSNDAEAFRRDRQQSLATLLGRALVARAEALRP